MTSDKSLAFAQPALRAEATADGDPCDRISLTDHVIEVEIGAFQSERGTRQRLRFDVVVEVRPPTAPSADDVDRVLSYDRIAEAIAAALARERLNLLETLAEQVAGRLLAEPRAKRVFVRIAKLDRGPGALGVEIVRSQRETPAPPAPAAGLPPVVVYLDAPAVAAAELPLWLTGWQAAGLPVVLTVGPPAAAVPQAAGPAAQRRIDLLAIEQQAWMLAARDPRCTVAASRTEIDWAMRQGRVVVWAPSKLVLDAVDGPADTAPLTLALWLAETLAAARLVVHGPAQAPAGSRVPVVPA
jgi:dihydroneopterin aldolase